MLVRWQIWSLIRKQAEEFIRLGKLARWKEESASALQPATAEHSPLECSRNSPPIGDDLSISRKMLAHSLWYLSFLQLILFFLSLNSSALRPATEWLTLLCSNLGSSRTVQAKQLWSSDTRSYASQSKSTMETSSAAQLSHFV